MVGLRAVGDGVADAGRVALTPHVEVLVDDGGAGTGNSYG